jgi:hypothetical protein
VRSVAKHAEGGKSDFGNVMSLNSEVEPRKGAKNPEEPSW